jgi:hypothetical protein
MMIPLGAESDGLGDIVRGVEVKEAHSLGLQPCPRASDGLLCRWAAAQGETFDAVIERITDAVAHPTSVTFQSAIRFIAVAKGSGGPCAPQLVLTSSGGALRELSIARDDSRQSCDARLETTLVVSRATTGGDAAVPSDGTDIGLRLRLTRGRASMNGTLSDVVLLPIACGSTDRARGGRVDCRITVDTDGQTTYALDGDGVGHGRRTVVLLRRQDDEFPPVSALKGPLSKQEIGDVGLWDCGYLPGDRWDLTEPKLRRLSLGASGTFTADLEDIPDHSCTWPWQDILNTIGCQVGIWSAIGSILLQLGHCLWPRLRHLWLRHQNPDKG